MIIVSLLGADRYMAIEKTKALQEEMAKIYGVDKEELEFFAPESFIIHGGMEQTFYHLNIRIEAPYEMQDHEESVLSFLKDSFKDMAVHLRILFTYFDPDHEYVLLDPDYPKYMNDKNVVKVDHDHGHGEEEEEEWTDEEKYEEPYMGDIIGEFDRYIEKHPDATDQEIYQALTDIRKDVTEKHHEARKEGKENA